MCHGQALDALGRTREALGVYLAAARQLGESTPAPLAFLAARGHAQLGQRGEARAWLARARAAAPDPALEQEIRRLEEGLRGGPR
jgi:hypothetical protein